MVGKIFHFSKFPLIRYMLYSKLYLEVYNLYKKGFSGFYLDINTGKTFMNCLADSIKQVTGREGSEYARILWLCLA